MASIPCTFQGVLFFSDLGVGGGPMPGGPYPDQGLPGKPPGIWGGPPLYPDQGLPGQPGQPPSIWPSPGRPSHPIAGQPPGIWPSPGHPDQGLPGKPPGIWGGAPPYVDIGGPGPQPHPSHPIVIPPGSLAPGIPSQPIYWPIEPPTGPSAPGEPPTPTHPIVIPGDDEQNPRFEVKTGWSPQTGWVAVIVPTGEHPAPAA